MAVKKISVSLVASFPGGRAVTADEFVRPLAPQASDPVLRTIADRPHASARVDFFEIDIASFPNTPERYVSFDEQVAAAFSRTAAWLAPRVSALQAMAAGGMKLFVLVALDMSQGQMELTLPPVLLASCGQAGLPIYTISNE